MYKVYLFLVVVTILMLGCSDSNQEPRSESNITSIELSEQEFITIDGQTIPSNVDTKHLKKIFSDSCALASLFLSSEQSSYTKDSSAKTIKIAEMNLEKDSIENLNLRREQIEIINSNSGKQLIEFLKENNLDGDLLFVFKSSSDVKRVNQKISFNGKVLRCEETVERL